MKNIYQYSIYGIITILSILACTKEADVLFSFEFSITGTHNEVATINYREPTFIKIEPERIVTDNVYRFKYELVSGNGYLRYINQNPLALNEWHICESLELDFEFIGTEIGEAELKFTVTDIDAREEIVFLTYDVIHNPFIWEANTTTNNVTITQTTPLNLVLDNIGLDQSVTYQSKIYFSQGSGHVLFTDGSGVSTSEIEQNEYYNILPDIHAYNIEFLETGENIVVFESLDSNGQVKTDTLTYNVSVIEFSYNGTPQVNNIFVGETTNLNYQITELFGGGDTYESRFEFASGNATISRLINGTTETLNPGVYYPVNVGAYYWEFEATQEGTIDLICYAKNSSGVEHQIPITINVSNGSFVFNAIGTQNFAAVNDDVLINFNIDESGPDGSPYTLIFESTSNGTLTIGGNTYNAGQTIPITNLSFSGFYTGLINGAHDITFTVTNTFNDSIADDVSILFNEDAFVFVATPETQNTFLGNSIDFNFNISDSNNGATYQMYYTVTGAGQGQLSNGSTNYSPGVFYNVINGGFSWDFEGTAVGDLTYTFFVVNNSGNEQSQAFDINVSNGSFVFNATGTQNFAAVNDNVLINFNINESGSSGSPYTMIFESSSNGTLEIDGNTYTAGQTIAITNLSFSGFYTGLINGTHDITFTVTNTFNDSIADDVSIEFNEDPYVFTAVPETENIVLGDTIDFNFNIADNNNGATYQMYYTVTGAGQGGLSNGSTVYSPGVYYNVTNGGFTWGFDGTTIGNLTYTFYVINNSGNQQSQSFSVTVNSSPVSDFTITAIASNNTASVNETVPVNLTLTETVGSSTYSMVFTSSGTGSLNYNGVNYTQGTPIVIVPGSFTAIYTGLTPGIHDINFNVTNTNSTPISHDDDISITFNSIDFSISTVGDGSLLLNTTKEFFTIVTQNQTDPNITYQVRFNIVSGSTGVGEIYDASNNLIPLGNYIPINLGSTLYRFKGISPGDVGIFVEVLDSNNVLHNSTLNFEVESINFSFTAVEQDGSIVLGTNTPVFFEITEFAPSGTNYEIKYEITSSQTANLINVTTPVNPNTYIPIGLGSSSWIFESVETGSVTVVFTVRNTSTLEIETDSISINITQPTIPDFSFTAIPASNTSSISSCVDVNFNLTELNGASGPFSMVFTSSDNGTFTYNGATYSQGQTINLGNSPGAFVGCYKGTNIADHDIDFTITNSNTTPISHTEDININFISDFAFTGSASSDTIFLGETSTITLDLSEIIPNSGPYTFSYLMTGAETDGDLEYNSAIINSGTNYSMSPGITVVYFTPNVDGNFIINFTATNGTIFIDVDIPITVDYSPPVLSAVNTITYNNYDTQTVDSQVNPGGGYVGTNRFFNLQFSDIIYTPNNEIIRIEINGIEYNVTDINAVTITVGFIYVNHSFNLSSSSFQAHDDNISIKRGTPITIRLVDEFNQYSNSIEVNSPSLYGITVGPAGGPDGVYFNGGYCGTTCAL